MMRVIAIELIARLIQSSLRLLSIRDSKSQPLENCRDDRRRIDAFSYEEGRRFEFGGRS